MTTLSLVRLALVPSRGASTNFSFSKPGILVEHYKMGKVPQKNEFQVALCILSGRKGAISPFYPAPQGNMLK